MSNFFISYINLSPGLFNSFANITNKAIVSVFRTYYFNWQGFFEKHEEFSLGMMVVTKRGTQCLEIKGPTISRKKKIVDYSIFLPDAIEKLRPGKAEDVNTYLDWIFTGTTLILSNYDVAPGEIEKIKEECKKILNLI